MSRRNKIAVSTLVVSASIMFAAIAFVAFQGPGGGKQNGQNGQNGQDEQVNAAAKPADGSPTGDGVPDFFLGYEPNRIESDQFIQSLQGESRGVPHPPSRSSSERRRPALR